MPRQADDLPLRAEVHYGRVVRCHAHRPANVYAMFQAALARAPEKVALVDGDRRLTYRDVDRLTAQVAGRLAGAGVEAGDRVALLLDNRADMLVALLAIARIGAISVPMNIRQRRPETVYAINHSGAAALIHEASLASELPAADECPRLTVRLAVDSDRPIWSDCPKDELPDPLAVEEDAPFCILYTSGTTGRPKGAVLTHFGVVTNCLGARSHLELEEGDVTVLAVPASHVTGVMLVLMVMVELAGTTVVLRDFKAERFLRLAAAERMTYAIMVPAMYTLCLMDEAMRTVDLSSWRTGAYGGAPMPAATAAKLAEVAPQLRLYNIYGATETTSPAVIMPAEATLSRLAQVGRPLSYCDLIIMDAQGREVPRGEQGEIWIGGPGVVPGYWDDPAATDAAFVGGFWKTGDVGKLDADGFLTLLDRTKDVINRGGFKIYSVEVENRLASHPSVIEAGVVGRPCAVLGERVEAFVSAHQPVTEGELRAHCAEALSDYKVPDHIRVLAVPLPRNANGKLLKTTLRSWLEDETSAAAGAAGAA